MRFTLILSRVSRKSKLPCTCSLAVAHAMLANLIVVVLWRRRRCAERHRYACRRNMQFCVVAKRKSNKKKLKIPFCFKIHLLAYEPERHRFRYHSSECRRMSHLILRLPMLPYHQHKWPLVFTKRAVSGKKYSISF